MIGTADIKKAINSGIAFALSNIHTATINCKPVINRNINGNNVILPEFIEVPPVFMAGGSSYTAHPITVGDYALLIFTERCFDRWYEGNDFQLPAEYRMHDYSDGFAFVGVFPRSIALTIPDVITQIGDTYQEGDYERKGDLDMTGDITLTGDQLITGNLTVNISITAPMATINGPVSCQSITVNGLDFSTHVHGGIEVGTGTSGGPQ
jgi:hypothetical protein